MVLARVRDELHELQAYLSPVSMALLPSCFAQWHDIRLCLIMPSWFWETVYCLLESAVVGIEIAPIDSYV